MRVLIVFLVIVALAGAAFGSYAMFVQPTTAAAPAGETGGVMQVTEADILAIRGDVELMREKYESRLEELEDVIGQQAKKINELNKRVTAIGNGAPAVAGGTNTSPEQGGAGPASRLSLADADRESLKELLGELSEERRRDDRQNQFDRMQKEAAGYRSQQIDKMAQKFKWDEQKKQQVLDVLAQERKQTEAIWQEARSRDLSQDARRELMGQIRQINEQTQEALKAFLTEEEQKSMKQALNPRRERRTGGRGDRFQPGRGGR